MTTILADFKAGAMVADSCMTDDTRVWSIRKIVRHKGMLIAGAGVVSEYAEAIAWFKANGLEASNETPPKIGDDSSVLILTQSGLWLYDESMPVPQRMGNKPEAIGSGAALALAAYAGIGKRSPEAARAAVRIACRHDANSRGPVRVHKLSQ